MRNTFKVAALATVLLASGVMLSGCGGSAEAQTVPAPTRADEALEIANLQGRYLHALNANQLDLVPTLFSQAPDASLTLPTGAPVSGVQAITAEFAKLKGMVTAQGGFMGTHLATTPVIKVNSDGTAEASWMSTGFTVLGPAFGNLNPPYPTLPAIGRYSHEFVKEGGVWKFKHFRWTLFASLPPFQYDPATAGPGWANTPMVPGSKATPWPPSPFDK